MSRITRKYYIKRSVGADFCWNELEGATSLIQAKRVADQKYNLGEIGMLHLPFGVEVISKKNARGAWEDVR